MLRPAISDLLEPQESRYSLVVGVAKIARKISDEAQENNQPLEVKPVSLAVEMLYNKEYKLVEPKDTEDDAEDKAEETNEEL